MVKRNADSAKISLPDAQPAPITKEDGAKFAQDEQGGERTVVMEIEVK